MTTHSRAWGIVNRGVRWTQPLQLALPCWGRTWRLCCGTDTWPYLVIVHPWQCAFPTHAVGVLLRRGMHACVWMVLRVFGGFGGYGWRVCEVLVVRISLKGTMREHEAGRM